VVIENVQKRAERGFTVIEVLVAMTVALFGLGATLGLHTSSSRATSYSRHASEAAIIGEAKLEQLIVTPSAALAAGNDRVDASGIAHPEGAFTRSWTVEPGPVTYLVTVVVAWSEDDGPHEISYHTRRTP
jgi:prepilin-type N-terminal cleavage/methylation domain-containing protein